MKAFEQIAIDVEKVLPDLHELNRKTTLQQEREMKSLLEKVEKEVVDTTEV